MNNMKIWFLTGEFAPDFGGGIGTYVENCAKMFAEAGDDVTVIVRSINGDKTDISNYSDNIIALPGKDSPEKVIFDYAEKLFTDNDDFWTLQEVDHAGYDRVYYRDNIQSDFKSIVATNEEKRSRGERCKGELRRELKKLWKDNRTFVILLIKHWINNPAHSAMISDFTKQLNIMFMKTAEYHGINKNDWNIL